MMDKSDVYLQQSSAQLIKVGRFFFEQGWVPATSGNFSARLDSQRMIIAVSGWHKGELSEVGLILSDLDGHPLTAGKRPSAETLPHAALYRSDSEIGAVLHTHSIYSTVLSRLLVDKLVLSDYEVLKAFPSVETHQATI